MDVRNCRKCNKLFNYINGQQLCPSCRDNLEAKFKEVRIFIRKNPHASIIEVSEANEVDVKQIKQWIREERLSFSDDSTIGIECEGCGVTIKTGRYCEACKASIVNNLNSAYEKKGDNEDVKKSNDMKNSNKMRFLNKDNI